MRYPENIQNALKKKLANPTAALPKSALLKKITQNELDPFQLDIYTKRFVEGKGLSFIADSWRVSHQYISQVIYEQILPAILKYEHQFAGNADDVLIPDFQKYDPKTVLIERTCLSNRTIKALKNGEITYDNGETVTDPILTLQDLFDVYDKNGKRFPKIKGIASAGITQFYQLLRLCGK